MPTVNLLNGDCLELMNDIPDSSIDCIICDLHYGVTAQNEWDKKLPLDKLWSQYLKELRGDFYRILAQRAKEYAEGIASLEKTNA